MIKCLTVDEAANRLGITPEAVRKRCMEGKFPDARERNGKWRIPVRAVMRAPNSKYGEQAVRALRAGTSHKKIMEAARRYGMILSYEELARQRVRDGMTRTDALNIFIKEHGIAKATFEQWLKRLDECGICGLIE